MLHKISKSFICFLVLLSAHTVSYAEGIAVELHNFSGTDLTLTKEELISGNWYGYSPHKKVLTFMPSWYAVTPGLFSGPEARSIYQIDGTGIELMTYVNSDIFSLQKFNTEVCLRKTGTTKCSTSLGGYRIKKTEKSEGYNLDSHFLDVYITNPENLRFEDLCIGPSKIESNKLINGVIALDTNEFGGKSYSFYGENDKVIGITKSVATDITSLDLIKTAYLTGVKVTYCSSSTGNLEHLIIRR